MMEKTEIEKIIDTFASSLDINKDYDVKDLKYYLGMACRTHKKKSNNRSNKPRTPSEYNLFVRHQMAELKETEPTLNARDRFKRIGELWKEHKMSN
jgi:hypothetical protein